MMKRCLYLFAVLTTFSLQTSAQNFTLDSTTIVADTLITGLNVPWEITWGQDDHIWMTEREGKVSRINPSTGLRIVIADLRDDVGGPVYQSGEAGLLGLALHPDFPDSSYVYLVYTYQNPPPNTPPLLERMVKYRYHSDTLVDPFIILENITAALNHNGSRLVIGPDKKLYMSTGDALDNFYLSQNLNSLNGKVLRFNLDGSIPFDNPISGSYLWSWGHRNHQGLAFGPTGILYSSEHGTSTDDELNIILKGRNFGWPDVQGYCDLEQVFCSDSNVVEPLLAWTPTIAPSDLIYYDHSSIREWQGTLLMTVLKEKRLIQIQLNGDGNAVIEQSIHFNDQWGRLRDICAAPDGTIYIATNGDNANTSHSIIRIKNDSYTGIKNIPTPSFTLYPNPSTGSVTLSGLQHVDRITVMNAVGMVIREINQPVINGSDYQLNLFYLEPGIYFIGVESNGAKGIQKLIKY